MDTIQHNPARLYNCDKTGISIAQHKHTIILGLKCDRQISSRQSAERRFLWQPATVRVQPDTSPPLLAFPRKKYETRIDERHTGRVSPHVSSLGVDRERDVFPVVSSFQRTHKADKRRSCYASTGRELFTHQEPGGHYFSPRESCWHHLPPHHSSHKTQPLDKAFIGALETFYCQEIGKWLRSHPGRVVTVYQIVELFGNAYKRAATVK